MSSRCSFELVQKCAIAGIGALATVSAPTALALSLARQAHLKLAALSNRGVMIFDRGLTTWNSRDMIRMANQIAAFFNGSGPEVAVKDTAEHINKFWDPRMRTSSSRTSTKGGEGLDPTILKTKGQIRPPKLADA